MQPIRRRVAHSLALHSLRILWLIASRYIDRTGKCSRVPCRGQRMLDNRGRRIADNIALGLFSTSNLHKKDVIVYDVGRLARSLLQLGGIQEERQRAS